MKMLLINTKFTQYSQLPFKQSGSVLIVVIFVIVVMGLLAGVMARLEWSNQDTQTRELLGTQAWFMAHSSNEWALTELYPLGESAASSHLKPRCDAINGNWESYTPTLTSSGHCKITSVTCSYQNIPEEYEKYRYYTVESVASCGGEGLYQVERAQQVVVKGIK
ncbi:MSHA biogenesis protein MshP [Vibrio casei]|uniref:MSHA biogenesis protein MshP n=1 Tax=Vibrio casei TaxID=673372 RepID=UPI003F98DA95